jgi:hypothetical protein
MEKLLKLILLQLLLYSSPTWSASSPPAGIFCPTNYNEFYNYKCYFLSSTSMKYRFDIAENYCSGFSGGQVAVPLDLAQDNFLAGLITSDTYIGINDGPVEGTWTTYLGIPITYTRWAGSQPAERTVL